MTFSFSYLTKRYMYWDQRSVVMSFILTQCCVIVMNEYLFFYLNVKLSVYKSISNFVCHCFNYNHHITSSIWLTIGGAYLNCPVYFVYIKYVHLSKLK